MLRDRGLRLPGLPASYAEVRVFLELALHGVAVGGSWVVWPAWLAAVATLTVVAALVVGLPPDQVAAPWSSRRAWIRHPAQEAGDTVVLDWTYASASQASWRR